MRNRTSDRIIWNVKLPRFSPILTHRRGRKRAESEMQQRCAAVSDYDRVRNIPFHRSRQLESLFLSSSFPVTFFFFPPESIDLYVGAEMHRGAPRLQAFAGCISARDAETHVVTLFVSTRGLRYRVPTKELIELRNRTGEKEYRASEMERVRDFCSGDIKYAVARKLILGFICHLLSDESSQTVLYWVGKIARALIS